MTLKLKALVLGVLLLVSPAMGYSCLEVPACPLSVDHKHLASDNSVIILGDEVKTWKLIEPPEKDNKNSAAMHGRGYGIKPPPLHWRI